MALDQVKLNGQKYDIGAKATNVSFDRTGSSFKSTNVQDALLELSPSIASIIDSDTTENWNIQVSLVSQKDHIYVYTDYAEYNNVDYPGIKIGDGTSYLIDMPFVNGDVALKLTTHINNNNIHVTSNEKEKWDEKIRCYISPVNGETLVFTTN